MFVDAAIESLRRQDRLRSSGHVPADMVDPDQQVRGDWVPWRPIPSQVTDADLDELEAGLGLKYPRLYRELLKNVHYVMLTEFGVRFFGHESDSWRAELENAYRYAWKPMRIVGAGLIPFGSECLLDAGPVCFDTRRMVNGDCPVVYWDHEAVGTNREIAPMFSSVDRMFRCLTFAAEHDELFVNRENESDRASVALKRELLEQFLALDVDGAGGPAREYWTSFAVSTCE
jgi:hypothetical protein